LHFSSHLATIYQTPFFFDSIASQFPNFPWISRTFQLRQASSLLGRLPAAALAPKQSDVHRCWMTVIIAALMFSRYCLDCVFDFSYDVSHVTTTILLLLLLLGVPLNTTTTLLLPAFVMSSRLKLNDLVAARALRSVPAPGPVLLIVVAQSRFIVQFTP